MKKALIGVIALTFFVGCTNIPKESVSNIEVVPSWDEYYSLYFDEFCRAECLSTGNELRDVWETSTEVVCLCGKETFLYGRPPSWEGTLPPLVKITERVYVSHKEYTYILGNAYYENPNRVYIESNRGATCVVEIYNYSGTIDVEEGIGRIQPTSTPHFYRLKGADSRTTSFITFSDYSPTMVEVWIPNQKIRHSDYIMGTVTCYGHTIFYDEYQSAYMYGVEDSIGDPQFKVSSEEEIRLIKLEEN